MHDVFFAGEGDAVDVGANDFECPVTQSGAQPVA